MLPVIEVDDDGLDDHDRARAMDMEESRPLYAASGHEVPEADHAHDEPAFIPAEA